MELRNLLTFMHVAELGSFTKAAQKLGYSQSTISFQIKQLEEELDCLLFERINHTISLTARGHHLLSYAHQVQALTDDFMENMEAKEPHGNVHIVLPDSVCEEMIYQHYSDFHQKYPHISIRFTTGDTSLMLDMLDHNTADVIITLDRRIYHKDYVIANEMRLPMHFVANPRGKFACAGKLSVRDIIDEPFILTEYDQGYRRVFDRELAKQSLFISPTLEIGCTDIITAMVAKSDMLSYLPDFVTKPLVDIGALSYLDVEDFHIDVWKQLIYHKNKWISGSLRTFIDYVSASEFSAE
ncbi:MAG: LysR family transcriptional regulator [Clostridia bacterium]|nr:LysR family transcriptional regulator [Clostridia bacterium]